MNAEFSKRMARSERNSFYWGCFWATANAACALWDATHGRYISATFSTLVMLLVAAMLPSIKARADSFARGEWPE